MTVISESYKPSIVKSPEDVNSKTTTTGTGWSGNTWTGQWELMERNFVRSSDLSDVGGIVFFEFGNDGVNVASTFPVAGFDLGTFHEYHGADLSGRWFRKRVVFDSLPTSVQLHTWFSDEPPALNSPLSQGVSTDQDATTVKAVLHGENFTNPGTFIQGKMTSDGAIRTSIVSALINFQHDYYIVVDASASTDRYDYYQGGSGGTKVAEILVTYKSTAKNDVLSAGLTLI